MGSWGGGVAAPASLPPSGDSDSAAPPTAPGAARRMELAASLRGFSGLKGSTPPALLCLLTLLLFMLSRLSRAEH